MPITVCGLRKSLLDNWESGRIMYNIENGFTAAQREMMVLSRDK